MQKTGIASIDKFFNYGEVDTFQSLPFTPLIDNVLEMFQSEYTENLYDRKANQIIKFCNERPNGFFYAQIQGVTKIFQFAKNDLFQKQIIEMIPALQRMLEVISKDKNNMFNKSAGSDQLRYLNMIPAYLDSLQPFLCYQKHTKKPNSQLQLLRYSVVMYLKIFAYKQLPQILSQQQNQNNKQDLSEISPREALMAQGTKHLRALSQSKVVQALVQLLFDYQNQMEILIPLLQCISSMVNYSRLAYELCQRGILHIIFQAMLISRDFRNPTIQIAFEIFWSCIEGVGVECMNALANQDYVWAIKNLFEKVVNEGYKLDDKCLRNELLILINYMLSLSGIIDLYLKQKNIENKKQQNFLQLILKYAIIDEQKYYENKIKYGDKKTMFGITSQDLQFKKLLWSGILMAIQSGNQQVIKLVQNSQFIKYMLIYLDTTNSNFTVSRWSGPQLRQLQKHALSILADVILHMKDDFQAKKGIFCLTKFLSNVADVQRRQKCLRAFVNASLFQQTYKLKISQQGLIDYLLQFLQSADSPSQIRELCFTILSNLCKECKKNRKIFREKNGIQFIISGLKDKRLVISDRYALLALALLNCLWNCVLGSRRSQQIFINLQGVFDLLQFIQICAYSHRKLALSCLCCLVQNPKVIKQFLQWNGQTTMINATQLLIRLYSQEDQRFGVKYQDGIVFNRLRPLVPLGKKKDINNQALLKDFTSSGTETYLVNRIKNIVGSCDLRITIFSILYRVGFSKNQLNAQEQQKIQVIQLYPHFKIGEIWGEIWQQLKEEGIQPTADDEHWLRTSLQQFTEQMGNCVNTQTFIKKQYNANEQRELQRFFQVIKYNKQIK